MYGRDQITIKEKCLLLQGILGEIAESNNINFTNIECTYEDRYCHGSCYKLTAEINKLETNLTARSAQGFPIKLSNLKLSFLSAREPYVIKSPVDFDTPILDLELSTRSTSCLLRAGIDTLGLLASSSLEEIAQLNNINTKCLEEISQKLEQLGFTLTNNTDGVIAEPN